MKTLIPLISLMLPLSATQANNLNENAAYAILQNCLASAEQIHNENSQLDRYCIESYQATVQFDQ